MASIGDTLAAFLALPAADKKIVSIPSTTAIRIARMDGLKIRLNCSILPSKVLLISINTNPAKSPNTTPRKIPTYHIMAASVYTLFFICFLVAPILDNIPYCLIFSEIDISKLFLIQ